MTVYIILKIYLKTIYYRYNIGAVAQMVERSLCMREAEGSMPSIRYF